MYKYKGWLIRHLKKFKHGPLFDVYEKKTESQKSAPLSSIDAKLRKIEELLESGTMYETVTSVTRRKVTRSVEPKSERQSVFQKECVPELKKTISTKKKGLRVVPKKEREKSRPRTDYQAFYEWKKKREEEAIAE